MKRRVNMDSMYREPC